jgi:hypothetical protein
MSLLNNIVVIRLFGQIHFCGLKVKQHAMMVFEQIVANNSGSCATLGYSQHHLLESVWQISKFGNKRVAYSHGNGVQIRRPRSKRRIKIGALANRVICTSQ